MRKFLSRRRTLLMAGITAILLLGWIMWVRNKQLTLMAMPQPLPAWILALGPSAGKTLRAQEVGYGRKNSEADNPFSPSIGAICAQVDTNGLQPTNLTEFTARISLTLNGLSVVDLGNKGLLLWGVQTIRGNTLGTPGEDERAKVIPGVFNMCWNMLLDEGVYWASLRFHQDGRGDLNYEWAFQIIN